MKHLGIGFGISGLLLIAACAEDPVTNAPGTAGSGGSTASAGATTGGSGTAGGSTAGAGMTAGAATGGSSAGATAGGSGGSSGGSAAGSGGSAAGSGGSAAGSSGSGGGGTCETKLGKAIKFDGSKIDSVAGDLGADGTLGDKPRTLELWAKFAAKGWNAEHSVIELGKPGAPDDGNNVFGIDMSGRKNNGQDQGGVFGPYTHGCSDNNGMGAPPFLANPAGATDIGWLHLSWAYNPANADKTKRLEFTVNGNVLPTEFDAAKYTKTGDKLVGNTGYVLLGSSQNFGPDDGGWDGVMDEVRIWSVYRTPQQIKESMNMIVKPDAAGLIAYYQFNETDLANIADSTKNAAHKLAACTAATGACSRANTQPPTFVDSDIPGTFTCAP